MNVPRIWTVVALLATSIGTAPGQDVITEIVPTPSSEAITIAPPSWDPYAVMGSPGGYTAAVSGARDMMIPVVNRVGGRLSMRLEYLFWQSEGMQTPPLVTASPPGTPVIDAGVLGEPGTTVLFGGGELNDGAVSGLRFQSILWLGDARDFGIEGEAFGLEEHGDSYQIAGNGHPILARPFFDVTIDDQSAELVSFPGQLEGGVQVESDTRLRSLQLNGRARLFEIGSLQQRGCSRIESIFGYRYLQLQDDLTIVESLNSLNTTAPGTIRLVDVFRTTNEFNGVQLGVVRYATWQKIWLESFLRAALGNNRQTVQIAGGTQINESGTTQNLNGGLLAQRSNIGTYERDSFTIIPELGITMGVVITDWLHATVGYTVVYYPNVVRAGEQIDTNINPNLIPPEQDPLTGSLQPRFRFIESDYLAHGLSLGGEIRF